MVLYIRNVDVLCELPEIEDLYTKEYEYADMLQVFRTDILQYLNRVSHIIVDGNAVNMNTWEDAADLLQTMQKVPVLLILNDPDIQETYIDRGNYHILNMAHKDIHSMIQDWMKNRLAALSHTWIAVAGLTSGCGVTSVAMHLAAYIRQRDLDVSITECADVFGLLAEHYQWDLIAEDSYQWGGVLYNRNQIDEDAEYTIFDLGVLGDNLTIWEQCQIRILVVDGKPYRMQNLPEQLKRLREMSGDMILAFSFVPDTEKPLLRKQYTSEHVKVWFVPLEPDLFQTSYDYQDLVDGYIEPVTVDKKESNVLHFPDIMKYAGQNKGKLILIICILISGVTGILLTNTYHNYKENQITQVVMEPMARMNMASGTKIRLKLLKESKEQNKRLEVQSDNAVTTEIMKDNQKTLTTEDTLSEPENKTEMISIASTEEKIEIFTEMTTEDYKENTTEALTERMTESTTEATTEVMTETTTTSTTESTTEAALTLSLKGYQGQIYTGAQVSAIMKKMESQPIKIHLITRGSEGWYSGESMSTGISNIDEQCSFLSIVITENGEDVGLEFLQQ